MCDIFLRVNNEFFDPYLITDFAKNVQDNIHEKYWTILSNFLLDNYTVIVRLSGFHNDITDIHKLMSTINLDFPFNL